MKIDTHHINNTKFAEIIADNVVLKTSEDGLQILGDLYYQGFDKVLIHEKNIIPDFFDLKNGIAGEVLQKFAHTVCLWQSLVIFQSSQVRASTTLFMKAIKAGRLILWLQWLKH